jgi:hypothetical protein
LTLALPQDELGPVGGEGGCPAGGWRLVCSSEFSRPRSGTELNPTAPPSTVHTCPVRRWPTRIILRAAQGRTRHAPRARLTATSPAPGPSCRRLVAGTWPSCSDLTSAASAAKLCLAAPRQLVAPASPALWQCCAQTSRRRACVRLLQSTMTTKTVDGAPVHDEALAVQSRGYSLLSRPGLEPRVQCTAAGCRPHHATARLAGPSSLAAAVYRSLAIPNRTPYETDRAEASGGRCATSNRYGIHLNLQRGVAACRGPCSGLLPVLPDLPKRPSRVLSTRCTTSHANHWHSIGTAGWTIAAPHGQPAMGFGARSL